jgi:hypothetical protein
MNPSAAVCSQHFFFSDRGLMQNVEFRMKRFERRILPEDAVDVDVLQLSKCSTRMEDPPDASSLQKIRRPNRNRPSSRAINLASNNQNLNDF